MGTQVLETDQKQSKWYCLFMIVYSVRWVGNPLVMSQFQTNHQSVMYTKGENGINVWINTLSVNRKIQNCTKIKATTHLFTLLLLTITTNTFCACALTLNFQFRENCACAIMLLINVTDQTLVDHSGLTIRATHYISSIIQPHISIDRFMLLPVCPTVCLLHAGIVGNSSTQSTPQSMPSESEMCLV